METFITGSKAFFEGLEGFKPHDTDIVKFNPSQHYELAVINKLRETTFIWKRDKADDIINYMLEKSKHPAKCIVLLIPSIAKRVGMTVDKLPRIKPLIDALDYKHKYIEVIYNYYVENNNLELTTEQLNSVYEEYKKERPNIYNIIS